MKLIVYLFSFRFDDDLSNQLITVFKFKNEYRVHFSNVNGFIIKEGSCHSIRIIGTAKSAVHLDPVLKMTGLWKNGIFTVISNHLTILCVWCAMLRNTCIREKMWKIYLNWWNNWASTENAWFGDEYGSVKLENYPWTSTDQGSWIPHCSRYC